MCKPVFLRAVVVAAMVILLPCHGTPCSDGSHTCNTATQLCVSDNSTAGFSCLCRRADQQLDVSGVCVDLPDSQRVYLTTPVNTTGIPLAVIDQLLLTPDSTLNALLFLYRDLDVDTYKGIAFYNYIIGPPAFYGVAVYALLFTEPVTSETRQAVALSVLGIERLEVLSFPHLNVTVRLAGHTGIFRSRLATENPEDDFDWCSSAELYSCRDNSTCRDVRLRYDCPCDVGFVDEGGNCSACKEEFYYGFNCSQSCDCVLNNTLACDRFNGTCFCEEHWEGPTCGNDVNECERVPDLCGDPLFAVCTNQDGGYLCSCTDRAVMDSGRGQCVGAAITGPSPFDTDGSRDLHLRCHHSHPAEVTQYVWSEVCRQQGEGRCTLKPQPRWDDGKMVTCTVTLSNGQSVTAQFVIDLNYPPPSAPVIEGYTDGAILPVGHSLTLTCSVHGGKPLVTAVHFSCPSHDDVTLDRTTQNVVISTLRIQLTSSSDGMVCSCSAQWKNSTYSLSSSRLLRVSATAQAEGLTSAPESEPESDYWWYAVCAVLGLLCVCMFAVLVLLCRQRANSNERRRGHLSADEVTTETSAGQTSTDRGKNPPTLTANLPSVNRLELPPLNSTDGRDNNDYESSVTLDSGKDTYISDRHSDAYLHPLPHPRHDHRRQRPTSGLYDQIVPTDTAYSRSLTDLYLHPASPSLLPAPGQTDTPTGPLTATGAGPKRELPPTDPQTATGARPNRELPPTEPARVTGAQPLPEELHEKSSHVAPAPWPKESNHDGFDRPTGAGVRPDSHNL